MISILIPSNAKKKHRRAKSRLERTLDHILSIDTPMDYEIIVCSPHQININHPKIKAIKDLEGNVGSIQPVNQCLKASQGEYFVSTPDDHLIHPNCFNIQKFIEGHHFWDREYKITSTGWRDRPFGGPTGDITGILVSEDGRKNPQVGILAMPAGERATVENLLEGVIFNETFKHVAADNFLSAYIAASGELPIFMPDTKCDRGPSVAQRVEIRDRDRRAYLAMLEYWRKNPEMPYDHILDFNE